MVSRVPGALVVVFIVFPPLPGSPGVPLGSLKKGERGKPREALSSLSSPGNPPGGFLFPSPGFFGSSSPPPGFSRVPVPPGLHPPGFLWVLCAPLSGACIREPSFRPFPLPSFALPPPTKGRGASPGKRNCYTVLLRSFLLFDSLPGGVEPETRFPLPPLRNYAILRGVPLHFVPGRVAPGLCGVPPVPSPKACFSSPALTPLPPRGFPFLPLGGAELRKLWGIGSHLSSPASYRRNYSSCTREPPQREEGFFPLVGFLPGAFFALSSPHYPGGISFPRIPFRVSM